MGTPKELPSRLRAGIQYSVLAALDDGDCWVEYEELLDRANTLLVHGHARQPRGDRRATRGADRRGRHLVSQPLRARWSWPIPKIHRMEEELAEILRTGHATRTRTHR